MMSDPRVNARLREAVRRRAQGLCEYCRSPSQFSTQSFSVEHIVPRAAGGRTRSDNLALACQGCNNHKYTKTEALDPATRATAPLYHPRRHRWRDHFAWSEDTTLIIGMTPIGRATVEALRLNRETVSNLRWALHAVGRHPPAEPEKE
jgi:hypothetical protein